MSRLRASSYSTVNDWIWTGQGYVSWLPVRSLCPRDHHGMSMTKTTDSQPWYISLSSPYPVSMSSKKRPWRPQLNLICTIPSGSVCVCVCVCACMCLSQQGRSNFLCSLQYLSKPLWPSKEYRLYSAWGGIFVHPLQWILGAVWGLFRVGTSFVCRWRWYFFMWWVQQGEEEEEEDRGKEREGGGGRLSSRLLYQWWLTKVEAFVRLVFCSILESLFVIVMTD